ncbi:MAG TPA: Uma2 family endonuclease [Thermomicrobiales bacterium]|nr:Uma2 family endonuclease [Thermomicrobiales bacterium]
MAVERVHYKFTADEYHRMVDSGILTEDSRVELIEGEIVEMSPIGGRHARCVNWLTKALVNAAGDDAIVSVQNPVRLSDLSEPQPDLMLLRPRDYGDQSPGPEDLLLLIEVSDTTLAYDRTTKLHLYARAGVREVWIVDLIHAVVFRYLRPTSAGYRESQQADRGSTIASTVSPVLRIEIPISELFA